MTRDEFHHELSARAGVLSSRERKRLLSYCEEQISDRMEEGMSETDAVGSMESPEVIVRRAREASPQRKTNPVLLILASPFLLTMYAVIVTLLAAAWLVAIAAVVVVIAMLICGVAGLLGGLFRSFLSPLEGLLLLGGGFVAGGLGMLCVSVVKPLMDFMIKLSAMVFNWMRSLLPGRRTGV